MPDDDDDYEEVIRVPAWPRQIVERIVHPGVLDEPAGLREPSQPHLSVPISSMAAIRCARPSYSSGDMLFDRVVFCRDHLGLVECRSMKFIAGGSMPQPLVYNPPANITHQFKVGDPADPARDC